MSSGKGSNFERTIARQLSLWWTGGVRDDVFWRTATSGAWAHTRRKAGKTTFGQTGDLQAIDPIGQPLLDVFCIELKRGYGQWDILDLLDGTGDPTKTKLYQFWSQTTEQAAVENKIPLLIVRRDRRNAVALTLPLIDQWGDGLFPEIELRIFGLDYRGPVLTFSLTNLLSYLSPTRFSGTDQARKRRAP